MSGASAGFTVLLVGEILAVVILRGAAVGVAVTFVGVTGYAVAGNRAAASSGGSTRTAARDGSLAAVGAWLLTLPLRLADRSFPGWHITMVELVFALIVGALAGSIVARATRKAGGD